MKNETAHYITNNTQMYPNFHVWSVNSKMMNLLSNVEVLKKDLIIISGKTFEIERILKSKEVPEENQNRNNITADTIYYEFLIKEVVSGD